MEHCVNICRCCCLRQTSVYSVIHSVSRISFLLDHGCCFRAWHIGSVSLWVLDHGCCFRAWHIGSVSLWVLDHGCWFRVWHIGSVRLWVLDHGCWFRVWHIGSVRLWVHHPQWSDSLQAQNVPRRSLYHSTAF